MTGLGWLQHEDGGWFLLRNGAVVAAIAPIPHGRWTAWAFKQFTNEANAGVFDTLEAAKAYLLLTLND